MDEGALSCPLAESVFHHACVFLSRVGLCIGANSCFRWTEVERIASDCVWTNAVLCPLINVPCRKQWLMFCLVARCVVDPIKSQEKPTKQLCREYNDICYDLISIIVIAFIA